MSSIRVVLYGIGVIGRLLAEHLLEKKGVEIVGAIDINPAIIGEDLGEIIGKNKIGVQISKDVDFILSTVKPDIVCHTTSSHLQQTYNQFVQILNHGVNIVSTCEELSYPYATKEGTEYAEKLNKLAVDRKATILGTGINPGFLMDTLPITLSGICKKLDKIHITRQMNAANRRVPFQKKIGAGLTKKDFEDKIKQKEITGHVGLLQSIQMISDALSLNIEKVKIEPVKPVILERAVESEQIKVPQGNIAGLKQVAYGMKDSNPVITLDFRAYIGAPEELDEIIIEGEPPVNLKISPCIHGDHSTIAITANMIPAVINSEAGLKTMKDLPLPHATPNQLDKYL